MFCSKISSLKEFQLFLFSCAFWHKTHNFACIHGNMLWGASNPPMCAIFCWKSRHVEILWISPGCVIKHAFVWSLEAGPMCEQSLHLDEGEIVKQRCAGWMTPKRTHMRVSCSRMRKGQKQRWISATGVCFFVTHSSVCLTDCTRTRRIKSWLGSHSEQFTIKSLRGIQGNMIVSITALAYQVTRCPKCFWDSQQAYCLHQGQFWLYGLGLGLGVCCFYGF